MKKLTLINLFVMFILFSFTTFLLIGCKESTDAPPLNLFFDIKLSNQDGSSPLKENIDKVEDIRVNLIKPINETAEISGISYLDYPDCLRIQVTEWSATSKKDVNYEKEYVMEIHYPNEIRKKTDMLKIKVQFENTIPSITEASYNNEEAQYMGIDVVYFEIENV